MILFRLHNITLLEAVKHWNIFWSHSSRLVNVKFKVKRAILKRTWLHSAKIQKNLCATFVLLLRFWDRFRRSESSWEDCDYRPKYVWSPGFVCWYFEVIKSTTEWLKKRKEKKPRKELRPQQTDMLQQDLKSDVLQCCEEPEFLHSDVRDW